MCRGVRATVLEPIHYGETGRDRFISHIYNNIFLYRDVCEPIE